MTEATPEERKEAAAKGAKRRKLYARAHELNPEYFKEIIDGVHDAKEIVKHCQRYLLSFVGERSLDVAGLASQDIKTANLAEVFLRFVMDKDPNLFLKYFIEQDVETVEEKMETLPPPLETCICGKTPVKDTDGMLVCPTGDDCGLYGLVNAASEDVWNATLEKIKKKKRA